MTATAAPTVDHYCQWFQPNSFDLSRCSSCLRPRRMHVTVTVNGISAAPAATAAADDEDNEDYNNDDDADGGQRDGSQYLVRT